MNDTFLPGSGFDTYESQDKVLVQMDGSISWHFSRSAAFMKKQHLVFMTN